MYVDLSLVCAVEYQILVDLDRSNLGNARLQGLPEDVLAGDPTGVLFDWVNSAFFFSYVSPMRFRIGDLILMLNDPRFYSKYRRRSHPSYFARGSGWRGQPLAGAYRQL